MTYGRFTLEQWEKRNGNPYLEADGRWHRITDFYVAKGLGIVNYQAEECDPREVERWLAEQIRSESTAGLVEAMVEVAQQKDEPPAAAAAVPASPLPGGGQGGVVAEPEPETSSSEGWRRVWENQVEHDREVMLGPEPPAESKPKLATFARTKGWKVGRISNEIRRQYQEEYPD